MPAMQARSGDRRSTHRTSSVGSTQIVAWSRHVFVIVHSRAASARWSCPGPRARVDFDARSSDCRSTHTRSIVRVLVRFLVPCALLLAVAARSGGGAAAWHQTTPNLLQVITPGVRATVPEHPDVNVIARFVTGADGSILADASGLRAHLDGRDISSRFTPLSVG